MARTSLLCPSLARSPYDEEDVVTQLQEAVGVLLDAAGISSATSDKIMMLIAEAEEA